MKIQLKNLKHKHAHLHSHLGVNALKLGFLILLSFTWTNAHCQVRFQRTITNDYGIHIIKQDSKNYYYGAGYDSFARIVKLNSSGAVMWNHRYNASHYYDMTIDPEDNVVAVGDNSSSQFIVNSLGTGKGKTFNKEFAASSGNAKSIDYTLNSSGKLSGYIVSGSRGGYPYMAKLSKTGTLLWEKQFNYNTGSGAQTGSVFCIRKTYDGGYITLTSVSSLSNIIVTKFDSSNNITWSYQYDYGNPLFPPYTPGQISNVIQTDDNADGVKDDGYILADNTNGFIIKIQSNGSIDWSGNAYGLDDFFGGPRIRPKYLMQDNNGYLLVPSDFSSLLRINFISSSHTVMTPSLSSPNFFHKEYNATLGNMVAITQANDNGYMVVGDAGGANDYFIKTDATGASSTSLCHEATGAGIFRTSNIFNTNLKPNESLSVSSIDSGSVALTTTNRAVSLTTNCSLTCLAPATPILTSQQCDSFPDTLTVSCSSPGVDITWYRFDPGSTNPAQKIDSGTNIIRTTSDSGYYAVASYGTCRDSTASLHHYDITLYPQTPMSVLDQSNVYPSIGISSCTHPYVRIMDRNTYDTNLVVSYQWYKITSSGRLTVTPSPDSSRLQITDTGTYEVIITKDGVCAAAPFYFRSIYPKATLKGATSCDTIHHITNSGAPLVTLTATPNTTPVPGHGNHYIYTWYYRAPGTTTFTVYATTTVDSLLNCPVGDYKVQYKDTSNICSSVMSDILTYTSKDTSIHPKINVLSIDCKNGSPEIVCDADAVSADTLIKPIWFTWYVNGVEIAEQRDTGTVPHFVYNSVHNGDTIVLQVLDSGYCVHTTTLVVSGIISAAPTLTVYDGYYDSTAHAWVNTSSYGHLPCSRRYHQLRVTGTNLDNFDELGYKPILGAVLNRIIVSDTLAHFDRIYNIDSSYAGQLTFYVRNSSCAYDSVTTQINYAQVEPYLRWSRFNKPSNTLYIVEGTPALDFVQTDFYVGTLPSGTLAPATTTYIDAAGQSHTPSGSTTDKYYSLHPTATFPDNIFNAASDSVTSDTASNKIYSFDVKFHASSASNPKTECDNGMTREYIHVFRPIIKSSNPRFCGGSSSVTVTDSIFNFPYDSFSAAAFKVAITYYDAANNKLNSTPINYDNGHKGPIVSSYSIPTTYGNSYYIELVITNTFYSSFPICTIKKLISLSGAYLAHTIDFQQKVGGSYISVSNGDTVCISGGQFPDIKTLITPGTESLSGGTYTYQWYDAHGTAIAGDSGRIHNHLCDTFSLPIFHAATAAASYTYPFHVVVTELSAAGTLCSGATGTGHGCAVSKTLIYIDNTPSSITITQSATFFCGSSMQLYATYNSKYTYQWQELVNGVWTSNFNYGSGATRDTITINHPGTYRCMVTNPKPSYASCPAYSNSLTITAPVLTIVDGSGAYLVGTSNLDMSISIGGYFNAPFQWYYISSTGSAPSAVSGGTSSSLSPTTGGFYYLQGTTLSSCGSNTVYSNVIYVANTGCPTTGTPIPTTTTLGAGSYVGRSSYTVGTGSSITIGTTSAASTIVMVAGTSITVPSGTSLTLINCNISCCAGIWKGIDVKGGGSLTLTNCTINNAAIAVYSENGGAIAITGSKFMNNVNHIAISSYSAGKLSANISTNAFGNLLNLPYLASTTFFATLNNSNYGKMVYVNDIPNGFATGGSITSNRFDNNIPEANGWYASGIEFYNADSININTDSFGISGPYFDRGVYAENGSGSTSYLNFTGNVFMGNTLSKTFRTGIVLNNVQNCGIGGSVGSHNVFKYLVNGIEYYQPSTISSANSITYGDFEYNTYGFVGAPSSHPVLTGANNSLTNPLNVSVKCNKFIHNDFGILGSGNLINQGDTLNDEGNNFNKLTPSSTCTPTCSSLNNYADILWVSLRSTHTFYIATSYPGTVTTGLTSGSVAFNGSTVSNSSSNLLGTSANAASCWATFKRDETSIAAGNDSNTVLNVYPNPSYNYFTIQMPESGERVHYLMQVCDITGRRLYKCMAGNKPLETIDATSWASGTYFVTLVSESGRLYNVKIVKQQ